MPTERPAIALLRRAAAHARAFTYRHPRLQRFLRTYLPVVRIIAQAIDSGSRITPAAYQAWIANHDTLPEADRAAIRTHIAAFRHRPVISVVMPVYDPPEAFLRAAIESVQKQLYPCWELCIADDASPSPHVARVLADYAGDPRIKVIRRDVNGHISAATNSALAIATGEFVALMDHDDLLPEHALYEVAAAIEAQPELDIIFSDEDKVDGQGRRFEPYFKPDFDPDLLLGQNVISHLGVYRRSLIERLGGMREGMEGSQDYDLALRAVAATSPGRIHHIPAILYHWRQQAKGRASFSEASLWRCVAAAHRAVGDHLAAIGHSQARVEHATRPRFWNRVVWPLPDPPPMASVILAACHDAGRLTRSAQSILRRTSYAPLELIIVDGGGGTAIPAALSRLQADPRVRVLHAHGLRNHSRLYNLAAQAARGSVLVLLQSGVEVLDGSWLREMASQALRPDIGAVGPRLLQAEAAAAGPLPHLETALMQIRALATVERIGPMAAFSLVRRVPAISGACLAVRREVYEAAGGFDEANLPLALNDIDFCLRLAERGYANLWTPYAELRQRASASYDDATETERYTSLKGEIDYMRDRWGALLTADTPYNPNLVYRNGRFMLAAPPQRQRPVSQARNDREND
ncbi:MAG: glycosyltransferase [Acetobacteraceae bacterium]|nr:glycosyltransferase [Acetobacteraceae bacterium]